jgi:translation elongation factor EF-G
LDIMERLVVNTGHRQKPKMVLHGETIFEEMQNEEKRAYTRTSRYGR